MPRQPTLVGQTVLIVVDIQGGAFANHDGGIPHMPGYSDNMRRALSVIAAARGADIPVVFLQEIHRKSMVDYGRELDGSEGVHCREDHPATALPVAELGILPDDPIVPKRRYSGFFGTDLEIVLKGLKAQTLILVGGMTDVCVHYTFADAHQHDYYVRVVSDCVGGTSLPAHQASLNAMEYLQTGACQTADQIIAAMGHHKARAA